VTIIKIPGGREGGLYMIVLTGSDGTIRDKYFGGKLAVFTSYSSYWS
jgi:hypothetical protein